MIVTDGIFFVDQTPEGPIDYKIVDTHWVYLHVSGDFIIKSVHSDLPTKYDLSPQGFVLAYWGPGHRLKTIITQIERYIPDPSEAVRKLESIRSVLEPIYE